MYIHQIREKSELFTMAQVEIKVNLTRKEEDSRQSR